MKKIAALIISLCLSAGVCGCTSSTGSSAPDVKVPSYLKQEGQGDEQEAAEPDKPAWIESGESAPAEAPRSAPETAKSAENTAPPAQQTSGGEAPAIEYDQPTTADGFRYGIWWANDGAGDSYYFFAPDNRTGSIFTQENGMELGFSYEIYGNTAVFHMDGAEGSLQAMVEWLDSSSLILHWTDGHSESLSYYSAIDRSGFYYYTNSQLVALALDHFETVNGWRPSYAEADIGEIGLIEISLYDGEDRCELYTVDRFTASGTNFAGNPIELD